MKDYVQNLLLSFSYLLLIKNPIVGFLLLGISFINLSAGFHAIIAYISLIGLGIFLGLSREQMVNGLFTYNSILVGLSMGYLFEISPLSILFTITASLFTLLLSFALHNVFSYYLGLPILNIPFTITATLVYLSSVRYGNLFIAKNIHLAKLNIDVLPIWLSGLFKATGILIFLPYDVIGLGILCIIFIFSRINFFLIILGYYSGTLFLTVLKGSSYAAFSEIYSFNFILIALALGGLFLIPSVKSYIIAASGVLISVFVLDAANVFWSSFQIPVFTIPFAIVSLLILYVLMVNKFKYINKTFLGSPEINLEHFLNYSARFNLSLPQPHLPFSGEWKVYQAFDDEWTHKGKWSNAVDFVIENKEDHKTFRNKGQTLNDYYCYNKPVLSPISGTVIEVCDEYEDNPIGTVDKINNWGNYVIIYSQWKYYVEISHFSLHSITIKKGDKVTVGQVLGKCGNSGYSPQPHIHIQCQYPGKVGSPTLPFIFTNCIADGKFVFGKTLLKRDQFIKPLTSSKLINRKLLFMLDDKFDFELSINGKNIKKVTFYVKMAENSDYYLTDSNESAKLYFSHNESIFSFYRFEGDRNSPLKYLFIAMPSIPITSEKLVWQDNINASLVYPHNSFSTFLKSFKHSLFTVTGYYSISENQDIIGELRMKRMGKDLIIKTFLRFAEDKGFEKISIENSNNSIKLISNKAISQ